MKALVINLTGKITASNFDDFKGDLIKQIKAANKELATDQDFIDAADIVKQFNNAEKALIDAKTSALEQAADIQKLFGAIDEVSAEARQARLSLEKQIKTRKEEIKVDLIEEADLKIYQAMKAQDSDLDLALDCLEAGIIYSGAGLHKAIKNKKTLESMEKSLDDYVEQSLGRLNSVVESVKHNRGHLDRLNTEHKPLFQDEGKLLSLSSNNLSLEISKRIAVFEAEEAKRIAAELQQKEDDRIKVEEEATQAAAVADVRPPDEPIKEQAEPVVTAQKGENVIEEDFLPNMEAEPAHSEALAVHNANESFTVTALISGSQEDAMKMAGIINEQVGHFDCVVEIKLARIRKAA